MRNSVIVADIETVGLELTEEQEREMFPSLFTVSDEEIKVPKNYKNPEAIESYIREERLRKAEQNAEELNRERSKYALDPSTGRIACICMLARNAAGQIQEVGITHPDEKKLLEEFWSEYGRLMRSNNAPLLVTFNGKDFDIPFIQMRSIIHRVNMTHRLDRRRYYSDRHADLIDILSGFDNRKRKGLNYYAKMFGAQQKSGHGSMVDVMWKENRINDMLLYCFGDCATTLEVYDLAEGMI